MDTGDHRDFRHASSWVMHIDMLGILYKSNNISRLRWAAGTAQPNYLELPLGQFQALRSGALGPL